MNKPLASWGYSFLRTCSISEKHLCLKNASVKQDMIHFFVEILVSCLCLIKKGVVQESILWNFTQFQPLRIASPARPRSSYQRHVTQTNYLQNSQILLI